MENNMDNIYRADIEGQDLVYMGVPYRGNDSVGKLCRELKQGTLQIYRGSRMVLSGDIAKRAELSLTDNDKKIGYVKYKPFPTEVFNG